MKTRTLPLPVLKSPAPGAATNIYLGDPLKFDAAEIARDRYDWSLSKLVRELLQREISLKGGLVHAPLKLRPGKAT